MWEYNPYWRVMLWHWNIRHTLDADFALASCSSPQINKKPTSNNGSQKITPGHWALKAFHFYEIALHLSVFRTENRCRTNQVWVTVWERKSEKVNSRTILVCATFTSAWWIRASAWQEQQFLQLRRTEGIWKQEMFRAVCIWKTKSVHFDTVKKHSLIPCFLQLDWKIR